MSPGRSSKLPLILSELILHMPDTYEQRNTLSSGTHIESCPPQDTHHAKTPTAKTEIPKNVTHDLLHVFVLCSIRVQLYL